MQSDLFEFCLGVHREFDAKVWRRPSFHNARHVETNVKAALMLIDAAQKGEDVVGIGEGLAFWESTQGTQGTQGMQGKQSIQGKQGKILSPRQKSGLPSNSAGKQNDNIVARNISQKLQDGSKKLLIEQLRQCVRLAFGMHDLGNILAGGTQSKQGMEGMGSTQSTQGKQSKQSKQGLLNVDLVMEELGVEFLPGYRAKGSEERSKQIAGRLMDKFGVEDQDRWLVEYLMGETSFVLEDVSKPLALFMRVCDQLSNGCLINENMAYGLMLEWLDEDPERMVSIDEQINFTIRRIGELIPDASKREQLLTLCGVEMSDEVSGLPAGKMTVKEAVEWMENFMN